MRELLSKITTITYAIKGSAKDVDFHQVCIVILLPFHLKTDSLIGFTVNPPTTMNDKLDINLHSYITPVARYFEWFYQTQNMVMSAVTDPYASSTVRHELLHALLLPHPFLGGKTLPDVLKEYREKMHDIRLTEFGCVEPDVTTPVLFDLMKEKDFKTAVVDEYLIKNLGKNAAEFSDGKTKGLFTMWDVNNSIFFKPTETDNIMDYSKVVQVDLVDKFQDVLGKWHASVSWIDKSKRVLFKYQWEMARATVALLASY